VASPGTAANAALAGGACGASAVNRCRRGRAKDAAAIGFRDDFIYDFIKRGCADEDTLALRQMGREEAIKIFEQYKEKNMTIY
jgi:hypothetical protein